jgi:prevent-host-death family protein
MSGREPMTQTIKASEAREQWSSLLNQVFRGETRLVVERSGIPVAAIISTADLAQLRRFEETRKRDAAILDELQAAFKDAPAEEVEREIAKAIAEVRAENRVREHPAAEA